MSICSKTVKCKTQQIEIVVDIPSHSFVCKWSRVSEGKRQEIKLSLEVLRSFKPRSQIRYNFLKDKDHQSLYLFTVAAAMFSLSAQVWSTIRCTRLNLKPTMAEKTAMGCLEPMLYYYDQLRWIYGRIKIRGPVRWAFVRNRYRAHTPFKS